jgi:DNA-binding MarR family transcriptional regulator
MTTVTSRKQSRQQDAAAVVQAYMDLFVMMQFHAVSHWLMMELTFAQARALIILAAKKELTVSQLARLLGVGNPTASVLIQGLVERGLVTRREHPLDRRQTLISLSKEGAEIGAGRIREREKQWQRWLSRLRDDELADLARGLTALQAVVRDETAHVNEAQRSAI